ncbi:uncharacterized protein VTP21DRAFT_16 [Calcarisporiella thermophila]|uniref:uncharacterized protein n=1 Tax=Calcarisporiella thermophila TaxID=911321 RepID=UPI003743E593
MFQFICTVLGELVSEPLCELAVFFSDVFDEEDVEKLKMDALSEKIETTTVKKLRSEISELQFALQDVQEKEAQERKSKESFKEQVQSLQQGLIRAHRHAWLQDKVREKLVAKHDEEIKYVRCDFTKRIAIAEAQCDRFARRAEMLNDEVGYQNVVLQEELDRVKKHSYQNQKELEREIKGLREEIDRQAKKIAALGLEKEELTRNLMNSASEYEKSLNELRKENNRHFEEAKNAQENLMKAQKAKEVTAGLVAELQGSLRAAHLELESVVDENTRLRREVYNAAYQRKLLEADLESKFNGFGECLEVISSKIVKLEDASGSRNSVVQPSLNLETTSDIFEIGFDRAEEPDMYTTPKSNKTVTNPTPTSYYNKNSLMLTPPPTCSLKNKGQMSANMSEKKEDPASPLEKMAKKLVKRSFWRK